MVWNSKRIYEVTKGKKHWWNKIFSSFQDFLAVNDMSDLILQEKWIFLPSIYWSPAIITHAGHLGVTKTKALLRSKVFFPNIDKITTPILGLCTPCKSVTPSWTWWQTLHSINLDFLGPFSNGQYLYLMIDQHTKYSDIEFMRSTSTRDVIFALDLFFISYCIPNNTVSDNVPAF